MLLGAIALMVGFSGTVMGQDTPVNVNASASIVTALQNEKQSDMYFGNYIVANEANIGTVTLSTASVATPSSNLTLLTSKPTAAAFKITTAYPNMDYYVQLGSLDAANTLTLTNSEDLSGTYTNKTMSVNNLILNIGLDGPSVSDVLLPTNAGYRFDNTLSSTTSYLFIGGTLNVSAHQLPGIYTKTFTVSVLYN